MAKNKMISACLWSLVFVAALAQAQVSRGIVPPNLLHVPPHGTPAFGRHSLAAPLAAVSRAPLAANVIPADCPEPNSVCGYVQVPLDRKHPQGPKIGIYFEQYFHSNPGPAASAIMVNLGGPGIAMVDPYRDYFQFLFAPNLDVHDLLLVDDRGRGRSGAIDCPELQHGTADFATAEHDCAVQLGAAASRYGTGDVAQDMNDVRAALGYDLIDYLGASWGGVDAIAFATRFGSHVRSLVLDAPAGPGALTRWARTQSLRTHAYPRMIRLVCARSLLCAPDHPQADGELGRLIQSIRSHPLEGDTYDADGNPVHVRIDENALRDFVVASQGSSFANTGEVLAAAAAFQNHDAVPLLRLAAEGSFTLTGDSGDPTAYFSAGAYLATGCADTGQPWEWSDPVGDRKEAYSDFLKTLPNDYFAPFSKSAGSDILFSDLGKQCLWWEKPTASSPIVTARAVYPPAPTLVLMSDIDAVIPLEEASEVAALFPVSTSVTVAGAGHESTGYFQCARDIASQFIETLSLGDTTCANTPEVVWAAVGRFPRLAKDARPADIDPTGHNRIGVAERKVASIAVAAAIDALKRTGNGFSGAGVGLRGGTFETSFPGGGVWISTLVNSAFSEDVIVNGTVNWGGDYSIAADLAVSGAGTSGGTLHIEGFWLTTGPVGYFKVSGMLGGKRVAVLVPEA